jgi:hypothetical protein
MVCWPLLLPANCPNTGPDSCVIAYLDAGTCLRQRQRAPLLHGVLPGRRSARHRDGDGVEGRQRRPANAELAHLFVTCTAAAYDP